MREARHPSVGPVGLLGAALLSAACGHAPRVAVKEAAPPVPVSKDVRRAGADLSGTWEWVLRSNNNQGDLRVEQEEWHLTQEGTRLSGYYERQVMVLSMDQRLFRCNNALGYTRTVRARLSGELDGDRVTLRETALDAPPNPCDSSQRGPQRYQGQSQGETLVLRVAGEGDAQGQRLTRRPGGRGLAAPLASAASERPISGTWDWELRAVDPEGDLRAEREEWHLDEKDGEVRGFYERTVRRQKTAGVFSCNNAPRIDITTRYTIRGQRFGERVTLSEIDFQAERHPCENALRRLDSYQGAVSPTGQELMLSWGNGSQLLQRRRAP